MFGAAPLNYAWGQARYNKHVNLCSPRQVVLHRIGRASGKCTCFWSHKPCCRFNILESVAFGVFFCWLLPPGFHIHGPNSPCSFSFPPICAPAPQTQLSPQHPVQYIHFLNFVIASLTKTQTHHLLSAKAMWLGAKCSLNINSCSEVVSQATGLW